MWLVGSVYNKALDYSPSTYGFKVNKVFIAGFGQIDLVASIPLQVKLQLISSNMKVSLGH